MVAKLPLAAVERSDGGDERGADFQSFARNGKVRPKAELTILNPRGICGPTATVGESWPDQAPLKCYAAPNTQAMSEQEAFKRWK